MANTLLHQIVAGVILVGTASPALAQWGTYPAPGGGQYIVRQGSGMTGGYGQPVDQGQRIWVQPQPVQPVQQPYQPNPAQQNWQQYRPGNR